MQGNIFKCNQRFADVSALLGLGLRSFNNGTCLQRTSRALRIRLSRLGGEQTEKSAMMLNIVILDIARCLAILRRRVKASDSLPLGL